MIVWQGMTEPKMQKTVTPVEAAAGCSGNPPKAKKPNENYILLAEPSAKSNSFVGTEEYLAPEVRGAPVLVHCGARVCGPLESMPSRH